FTMLAIDRDELRATSFVAFANYYLIQPRADVGARIALQSSQQICARDHVGPRRVRAAGAILVAHAGQVLRWPRAPERGDVRGFAAARRAEICVDELAAIVDEHLAFSRANRGQHRVRSPTVREGLIRIRALADARASDTFANKSLAVRRRAEVVTVFGVPPVIFQSIGANRNCQ